MIGGAGNDTYVLGAETDTVNDTAGTGTPSPRPSLARSRRFRDDRESDAAGHAAINGTGNALANTITGNAGANILDGGAGVDTLIGGDGNDTYVADVSNDVVTETNATLASGGNDLVNFIGTLAPSRSGPMSSS